MSRTFRLFVSSTFADLAAEWNVLHEYCRERGASFQAIDLRWGGSKEPESCFYASTSDLSHANSLST